MNNADEKPKSVSLATLTKDSKTFVASVWKTIQPHFGFAYTVVLLSTITLVVYTVSQTLRGSEPLTGSTPTNPYAIRFDDKTIEKVRAIHQRSSDESFSVKLPPGRINPFSE